MEYRIYHEADFTRSKWTGGITTQLAIFPENAKYLERNFIWRLSSATCDLEETTFSRLPDYDRVLMVLDGNVVLAHQDVRVARLAPLEQDRFDGGYITKSFGKITDYNLMVAKGNKGYLDVIEAGPQSRTVTEADWEGCDFHTFALFCKEGYATVTIGGQTVLLSQGEQFVAEFEKGDKAEFSVMGEGTLIHARIFYCDDGSAGPEIIPAEKATFDDFKACIYLANTQFRGAKYIFKSLKNQWFDEELTKGIRKMETLYIPFFITVLGFCVILGLGYGRLEGAVSWILALCGWLLADIFLVSPLLYFAVVPKPVRKHIKDVHNLTPYEQKIYEKEQNTNLRVERTLKKYKNTGKIRYDKDGNGYMED